MVADGNDDDGDADWRHEWTYAIYCMSLSPLCFGSGCLRASYMSYAMTSSLGN